MSRLFFIFGFCVLLCSNLALQAGELGVPDRDMIEYPDFDPHSPEEIELGKYLYFDTRLSKNNNISCATCHNPDLGFSDGLGTGLGTDGNKLGRNAPHLYNLAWNTVFMWDGRAGSLEEQALGPIEADVEMSMPLPTLLDRLRDVSLYKELFNKVYPDTGITKENIGKAIAAFERTLISDNSAFDKYMKGDSTAMSPAAIRGLELFKGKANCTECHSGPNFTDESFHRLGLSSEDVGRGKFAKGDVMRGAFKTPGLRNVILTAPYMHNGSIGTLEEVVEFYNRGGDVKPNALKPLGLTAQEVLDIVAFMGALTDPVHIERPEFPE